MCKVARYFGGVYSSKDDTFKVLLDLNKMKNKQLTYKLNLLLRGEECRCNECNPDTSNEIIDLKTNYSE